MDAMTANAIAKYIIHVAADAFESEGRTGQFKAQFAELNGAIMLRFQTGFNKVDNKIIYRLSKNFERNMGKPITMDNSWANRLHADGELQYKPGTPCVEDDTVDPNHTVAFCKLLNKPASVNIYTKTDAFAEYLNPDFDESEQKQRSVICDKLEKAGKPTYYRGEAGWEEFCEAYAEIYGKKPAAQEALFVSSPICIDIKHDPSRRPKTNFKKDGQTGSTQANETAEQTEPEAEA